MARDYYEILGVSRDTDKEEMKNAYRRLARKSALNGHLLLSKKKQIRSR